MLDSDFTPLPVPRLGERPLDPRGETERARTRGYADGFAQGLRAAARTAERQQAAERERMQQSRAVFAQERGSALTALRASQDALDERAAMLAGLAVERIEALAIELAETILDAELSDPARSAAHALHRALAHTPISRWMRVTFDEKDLRVLTEDLDAASTLSGVEVIAASGFGAGGALVEIDAGTVDTRIAEALERAAAALDGDDGRSGEGSP